MTQSPNSLLLLGSGFSADFRATIQASLDTAISPLSASIGAFKSGERFCELFPAEPGPHDPTQHHDRPTLPPCPLHVVLPMTGDMSAYVVDLLNTAETARHYGAGPLHLVMPFAPFARQDRAFAGRMVSVMGETLPRYLKMAGYHSVTTLDMHSTASENFYRQHFGAENIRFLSANPLFHAALCEYMQSHAAPNDRLKFSAPDGADKPHDTAQRRIRELEKTCYGAQSDFNENGFGIVKTHLSADTVRSEKAFGDVRGCIVALGDDMIDTGGTTLEAARILKENGAKQVIAMATHAILSGDSLDRLTRETIDGRPNPIDHLMLTDSIFSIHEKRAALPLFQQQKVTLLSTAPLIAEAILATAQQKEALQHTDEKIPIDAPRLKA